jgi:transglutaminase-like putative cysteine protease
MLLSIDHVTRYRYDPPVRGVVQSHRLTPSRCDGQAVKSWTVTVTEGAQGAAFRDGAGDWIQAFTVKGPVAEIEVHVKGTVETFDTAGVLRGHRESVPPEAYLRGTETTAPDAAILALAKAAEGAEDRLSACHSLMNAVADAIEYDPAATTAATTAVEAMKLGRGVCQDHTHVLCAAARAAGIPARYVSGYLFADDEGKAYEAAHAWAELWVSGIGWIGFDAANRWCPDDRYVRLGSGLDAQAAAPIRGSSRAGPTESMEVSVAVQQVVTGGSQQ